MVGVLGILAGTTIAAEDVSTLHFTSIDLGRFRAHVFPSDDCLKQFCAHGARSLGEEDAIYWGDSSTLVISIGTSLFVNNRHYLIPESAKLVWILENEVFVPGKGLIQDAPVPADIASQIDESREDSFAQFYGIVFGVKDYYLLNSGQQGVDGKNFSVSMGPFVFSVKNGRLTFRGKDYGPVRKGDRVVLDEKGRLTLQSGTAKATVPNK